MTGSENVYEERLGTDRMLPLVLKMALPAVAAQVVNLLYNIVDRIYIGHMPGEGPVALTGIGLCFPVISLISAFAKLFGANGGAPLSAIAQGRGDDEEAVLVMGNSFLMSVLTGLALMAAVLVFNRPILFAFGASDATYPYARDYLMIYALGSVPVLVTLTLTAFMNSQGFSSVGMVTVIIGAVLNILLDPLLIFVFGMGIKGAAIATVFSQTVSCVFAIAFLRSRTAVLRLTADSMRLSRRRCLRIIALGTSGFTMGATNSAVQLVCNKCAYIWGGDLFVGVMTILNSVREMFSTVVNGIGSASSPVMSYNYGRQDYRRVMKASNILLYMMLVYTGFIWALLYIFPDPFIMLFASDETLINATHHALQIYFFGFIFMSLHMTGQQTFVALGYAKQAVFFSLFRKVIIVVPLTIILPYAFGVDGVVLAEPISNVIGGFATYTAMRLVAFRHLKKQLANDRPLN